MESESEEDDSKPTQFVQFKSAFENKLKRPESSRNQLQSHKPNATVEYQANSQLKRENNELEMTTLKIPQKVS